MNFYTGYGFKRLFAMKNLSNLSAIPAELQEKVFEEFFQIAEIAKMSPKDRAQYDQSRKVYLDNLNTSVYATEQARAQGLEEGRREGREEGRAEGEKNASVTIAKNMLSLSLSLEVIAAATGLSQEELQALKEEPYKDPSEDNSYKAQSPER